MKKYLLLLSLVASASAYSASIDHIQTYSPDYLSNQAQTGMINSVSPYYNPAGTAKLELGKKYLSAGVQYAFGYEKMSYKGNEHKAKLRQPVPNISLTSVDENGAYFINFGALGGGGKLKYHGVSGLDVAIEEFNLKGLGLKDNGTSVTGSNMYEQLTLGRAFNVDDKLSFSVAGRIIHGTRKLKGKLKVGVNPTKEFTQKAMQEFGKKIAGLSPQMQQAAIQQYKQKTAKLLKDGLNGDIDAKREAWGYGFQLGVNYKATEKLNLAARYDSRIKMKFKAKGSENQLPTAAIIGKNIGFGTFYPEYTKNQRRDMPAILSLGASYKATDKWLVSTAGNFYFNKHAKMDGQKSYKNGWELALGSEYKLNDKFTLISSINYARTGANDKTYSDVEYALNSTTLGAGLRYKYDETLDLTASMCHFFYDSSEGDFKKTHHPKVATENEKYSKSITAVGFSFTKKF